MKSLSVMALVVSTNLWFGPLSNFSNLCRTLIKWCFVDLRWIGLWSNKQPPLMPSSAGRCAAQRPPVRSSGAAQSPLAQPPPSGFQMSPDKHWHGRKETPPLPASCEPAALLAYSCSFNSENVFEKWRGVGNGGGEDALANPEKEDRNSTHSSCWKFGAADGAICQPICWFCMPSFSWHHRCQKPPPPFSICRQGGRYCCSVHSSCPKA